MLEHPVHGAQLGRPPLQGPALRPANRADADTDLVLPQVSDDGVGRTQVGERIEDQADGSSDLFVGVEASPSVGVFTYPIGACRNNSPHRALLIRPRSRRVRMVCNSSSEI
jgi:hypothetical protein